MAKATEQTQQKDLRQRFNEFLDTVLSAGPRFSMQQIQDYAAAAEEARAERVRGSTPVIREGRGRIVPRRGEGEFVRMTNTAIEASLDLAERFELAGSADRLDIAGWIRAGRG